MLCIYTLLVALHIGAVQMSDNIVTMTAYPDATILEGSSLAIQCDAVGFDYSSDELRIIHNTSEPRVLLDISTSGTVCNAELESQNIQCGSNPFVINITDITKDQGGDYVCQVTKSTVANSATITIDLKPNLNPPLCAETSINKSSSLTKTIGDNVQVVCSTSIINEAPLVLSWVSSTTKKLDFTSITDETTGQIIATLNFVIEAADDGIVITCLQNTSDVLYKNESTCSLGPFKVSATSTTPPWSYSTNSSRKPGNGPMFGLGAAIAIIVVAVIGVIVVCLVILVVIKTKQSRKKRRRNEPSAKNHTPIIAYVENIEEGKRESRVYEDVEGNDYSITQNESGTTTVMNEGGATNLNTYPEPPEYPQQPQQMQPGPEYINLPKIDENNVYVNTKAF